MALISNDILKHLRKGGKIYNGNGGVFALLTSGYTVKCSNASIASLISKGSVFIKDGIFCLPNPEDHRGASAPPVHLIVGQAFNTEQGEKS
jgi:hypothetical protein